MTTAYFSPTLNSFIPVEWKGDGTYSTDNWPSDAVLVTDEESATFWKQMPPTGKWLGAFNGRPWWIDEPAPTQEQIIALAEAKKSFLIQVATSKISILQDAFDLDMATQEEITTLMAWKKYRVLLNRVNTFNATKITWPVQP